MAGLFESGLVSRIEKKKSKIAIPVRQRSRQRGIPSQKEISILGFELDLALVLSQNILLSLALSLMFDVR